MAVFLDRALRGQPIQIWGDGSVVRDYVYVGDAVEALLKAARFDGEPRLFNIGSGVGTSLKQLVTEIEALLGRPLKVEYAAARALDVPANVLDPSLARRHLAGRRARRWPKDCAARTPRCASLMQVTLVTHYFPAHRGGVERMAGQLAERLGRQGIARIDWHASDCDAPPAASPGLTPVPAWSCNVIERAVGLPYPLWSPAALLRLARAVRAASVVHVHDCLYLPVLAAFAAARFGRAGAWWSRSTSAMCRIATRCCARRTPRRTACSAPGCWAAPTRWCSRASRCARISPSGCAFAPRRC